MGRLPGIKGSGPGFGVDLGRSPIFGRYAFKRGGKVPGKGAKDSVPAMLTPGEFVVKKTAATRNLPALQRMNKGSVVSHGQSAKDLGRGYRRIG
jgi:hypothetical protein